MGRASLCVIGTGLSADRFAPRAIAQNALGAEGIVAPKTLIQRDQLYFSLLIDPLDAGYTSVATPAAGAT